jgi:hypothetical protein
MIIHNKGPKATRDRAVFLGMYTEMVEVFHVKPLKPAEIAALDNFELHRLCQDIYAKQTELDHRWYLELLGKAPKSKRFWFRRLVWGLMHPKPIEKKKKPTYKKETNRGIPFANAV